MPMAKRNGGLPWVTVEITGTKVGTLWRGGTATKDAHHTVTIQAGKPERMRVKLADIVREITRDGDFDGPCVIEEAEVSIIREFPGATYVRRQRSRFYEVLGEGVRA
jgi:hypothetical protein